MLSDIGVPRLVSTGLIDLMERRIGEFSTGELCELLPSVGKLTRKLSPTLEGLVLRKVAAGPQLTPIEFASATRALSQLAPSFDLDSLVGDERRMLKDAAEMHIYHKL